MTWFAQNIIESLLIVGLLCIVFEWLLYRFTVLILFSVGVGMLTSALLAYSSLISPATSSLVICMLLATAFSLFVFRPSFVNLRSTIDNTRAVSDLVGYRFLLVDDVSESQTAVHHYSGIAWRLRSRDAIKAGTWVEVTRAELGEFTIRPRYER